MPTREEYKRAVARVNVASHNCHRLHSGTGFVWGKHKDEVLPDWQEEYTAALSEFVRISIAYERGGDHD